MPALRRTVYGVLVLCLFIGLVNACQPEPAEIGAGTLKVFGAVLAFASGLGIVGTLAGDDPRRPRD
jgi:hypothetical protein